MVWQRQQRSRILQPPKAECDVKMLCRFEYETMCISTPLKTSEISLSLFSYSICLLTANFDDIVI
ncbi:helix-turn-helix transcriptional regulator [Pantoea sp. S62]|nr:helix-turn-helix transcriptional regulator [Pantoea sp. S62]